MGKWTPLNLMCLAGAIDDIADCTVVDWNTEGERGVVSEIDRGYDIVGMSVMSPARWNAFDLTTTIRERSPDSLIVMGGVHATLMPEQVQKHCDVVIKGDGEAPFRDLCLGKEPVERFLPIDDLPSPAWDKVDLWKYPGYGLSKYDFRKANGVDIRREPRVSMQASRSCRSHCAFCSSFYVQGKYRMRDPARVVDDMGRLWQDYGIRHIYFNDDSFYLDKERGIAFCEEIRKRGLRVAFHIETRADVLDVQYAEALKYAGCYRVQVGLESGSPTIMMRMGKNTNVDAIYNGIQACNRAGLRVDANLIVGNVGETDETIEETRAFLREANPDTISSTWRGLLLLPGTAVYKRAKREGLINDSFWDTREGCRTYKYSKEQIEKWNRRILNYKFNPKSWFRMHGFKKSLEWS
jgi:radical SAM superfamily enzyme YgiQ (UPF0313 family)